MILFGSQKCNKDIDSFPVIMDNEILLRVEHETFLGLKLDENLRWYPNAVRYLSKLAGVLQV
jgi:hypothetical protein